jgi:hypothetical protein
VGSLSVSVNAISLSVLLCRLSRSWWGDTTVMRRALARFGRTTYHFGGGGGLDYLEFHALFFATSLCMLDCYFCLGMR